MSASFSLALAVLSSLSLDSNPKPKSLPPQSHLHPFSWPQKLPKMATAISASLLLHPPPLSHRSVASCLPSVSSSCLPSRRRSLFLLLSLPVPFLAVTVPPSRAVQIGLFGIRKRLEKIEQEAVEAVKEGEEAVAKEINTTEKELQSAAAAVAAEAGVAGAGFQIAGDVVQAGAVAGAEVVGVLLGLSVVNGILGPESQN